MNHRHVLVSLVSLLFLACSPSTNPPSPTAPDASPQLSNAPVASASPAPNAQIAPKEVGKPQTPKAEKLAVKRIVLARGIENKEPHDAGTTFNAKEGKIYAFVEVENPERLPGEVAVHFAPPTGKPTADVKLAVGDGARWRTWAFTRQAHEPGEWTAIVTDARGHELGRQTFNVEL